MAHANRLIIHQPPRQMGSDDLVVARERAPWTTAVSHSPAKGWKCDQVKESDTCIWAGKKLIEKFPRIQIHLYSRINFHSNYDCSMCRTALRPPRYRVTVLDFHGQGHHGRAGMFQPVCYRVTRAGCISRPPAHHLAICLFSFPCPTSRHLCSRVAK